MIGFNKVETEVPHPHGRRSPEFGLIQLDLTPQIVFGVRR